MTKKKFKNCLTCFGSLETGEELYHSACNRKLFGTKEVPELNYALKDVQELAKEEVNKRISITGVQPKISLDFPTKKPKGVPRLTIVGLWGRFILKPPHENFSNMPELEAATMHLARECGIAVALHGLIPFKSGELAYVSRRFDRVKEKKLAQEDFCQLTESLTEGKYRSSMEKAGKVILRWADNVGLDALRFWEIALFSFLTGNSDMHLKNFSLLTTDTGFVQFSPAYDLLPSNLLMPSDKEEMALPINGKKAKLTRNDFLALGKSLNIPKKAIENAFSRITETLPKVLPRLKGSPIPKDVRANFEALIQARVKRIA